MDEGLHYKVAKPEPALADHIESFWLLENRSGEEKEVVVLPDGRVDMFFSLSSTGAFDVALLGLETHFNEAVIPPQYLTFAISFKPFAIEYVLQRSIADLQDSGEHLPNDFWSFSKDNMLDFDSFCTKASQKVSSLLPNDIDDRKRTLFELIYASNGSLSVKELSEKVFWSSRQINRYFNQQFGITLKAYCNILRFRASFLHIKEGKLFPKENFADQSHFIKEVKKLSGVLPKELKQNQNDRFIQFSTLTKK